MKSLSFICLLLLAAVSVRADDSPAPLPVPMAAPPRLWPMDGTYIFTPGTGYRVVPRGSFTAGSGGVHYSDFPAPGATVRSYHAGSVWRAADMPIYPPVYGSYGSGPYGPMMIDVLLFGDISSRF